MVSMFITTFLSMKFGEPLDDQDKINDTNMQFIVLLQLIIERIEYLESRNYLFGSIKPFLKNAKTRFEDHIKAIFKRQSSKGVLEEADALHATSKLGVMQERVEKALANEYLLTVDERRERAKSILSKYIIAPMVDKPLS